MEQAPFDALAKHLARATSRRQLLKLLGAGLVGGLLAPLGAEALSLATGDAVDENIIDAASGVLVSIAAVSTTPALQPELAYVTGNGQHLWVSDLAGTTARQVVPGPVHDPSWSRDGQRIAYVRQLPPGGPAAADQVEVVNADGTGKTVIVPPRANPARPGGYASLGNLRWAPDDGALYYAYGIGLRGGSGIVRHDLATRGEKQLTISDIIFGAPFDVARDGTLVAFGDPATASARTYHLYLIPPAGPAQMISDMPGEQTFANLAWSPDATEIALAVNDRLLVLRRDGTELRQLVAGPVQDIAWSLDGTTLAYVTTSATSASGGLGSTIWTVPATGGRPTERFAGTAPTWRPTTSRGTTVDGWRQVTWEAFMISYPPGYLFSTSVVPTFTTRADFRAAAAIFPEICPPQTDCRGLDFGIATADGLDAQAWAQTHGFLPADAHNLHSVSIDTHAGIAFETSDPSTSPGAVSAFIVPFDAAMLMIEGHIFDQRVIDSLRFPPEGAAPD